MFLKICRSNVFGSLYRALLYCPKRYYSYEGDGKTTMSFLNNEADGRLIITGVSKVGFRLSSGLSVIGPVIMFPRTILSWNVKDDNDINEDSLALFYNLDPPVDLIVIGLSDTVNSFKNQSFFFDKLMSLRKSKLNFELLPTEKAIATYNFLTIENRFVAAALIPPLEIEVTNKSDSFVYDNEWVGKDDYLFPDVEDEKRDKEIAERLEKQSEKLGVRKRLPSLGNENKK